MQGLPVVPDDAALQLTHLPVVGFQE
jgi:hypothetical protein